MGKMYFWATLLIISAMMAYCIYYIEMSNIPTISKAASVFVILFLGIDKIVDTYEDIWYLEGLERR